MTDLITTLGHFPTIFNTKSYDNFIENFFEPKSLDKVFGNTTNYPPRCIKEIYDNKDDTFKYTQLEYALSGFKKEEINLKVEGNKLILSVDKEDMEENKHEKIISSNMATRSIRQSWTLSNTTDTKNIKSKFEDGLLTIKIYPKDEYQKQIEIK